MARLVASYRYYSGAIDQRYQESVRNNQPPWRILRYERITNPELHNYPIALKRYVRPKTFEMHLRYLKKHCIVVPLAELLKTLKSGEQPNRYTVAITFDNGWIDNYTFAFPLLRKYQIPATVFLATAYVGTVNVFWPEKLMQTVVALGRKGFQLSNFSSVREFFKDLDQPVEEDLPTMLSRASALVEALKYFEPTARQKVFDELAEAIDHVGGISVERSILTWEEVKAMAKAGVEFGTQGATHQIFTEREVGDIAADVSSSVRKLREMGVEPVQAYAFPEGVISRAGRQTLSKLGVDFALGIGSYPVPKSFNNETAILGRVPLYEAVSSCAEFLALRIWEAGLSSEES